MTNIIKRTVNVHYQGIISDTPVTTNRKRGCQKEMSERIGISFFMAMGHIIAHSQAQCALLSLCWDVCVLACITWISVVAIGV